MSKYNNIRYIHQSFIRSCDSKRIYKTEKEAKQTAEYQMLINQNLDLFVYKCDICSCWHLTKKTNIKN